MNQFGTIYSQYYDLLYKDKDYEAEVEYVEDLINKLHPNAKTILDMGCGTGRHAEILCEKGYIVHGVDLSGEMIRIAEERRVGKEDRLSFTCSDIAELNLDKKFDIVVSLFHVLSYQTSNKNVIQVFKATKKHLAEGGIFIFDFWYGPAVLTDRPSIRLKKIENEMLRIIRIAEPLMYPQENVVDVNYSVLIYDKKENKLIEIKETHKMRYFFDPELELICDMVGLRVLKKYEWMTSKSPDFTSWNVVWVVGN